MPTIHTVAADLADLGIRVVRVVGDSGPEYIFAGRGYCDVATCDRDFAAKMQQLPRLMAATIETYLRAARA